MPIVFNAQRLFALSKAAMQNGEEESKKLLRDVEKQQIELTARIKQLDNIIATLYEDRVIGRLSPESGMIADGEENAERTQLLAAS